jgi:hypothetical protein
MRRQRRGAGCMQVDNSGEELVSPSTDNHSKRVWRGRSACSVASADGVSPSELGKRYRLQITKRWIDACDGIHRNSAVQHQRTIGAHYRKIINLQRPK